MPNLPVSFFNRPVSARARLLAPAGIAAAALFRGMPAAAQTPEATGDASAMLTSAAQTMTELQSFHFVLTTVNGTTQFYEGLELSQLEGDVVRPDRFRASAKVHIVIADVDVKLISVGGRVWITDPTSGGDRYIDVGDMGASGFDPVVLLNPDRWILPAVDAVNDPVVAGQETINGADSTRIDGTIDLKSTLKMNGTEAPGWIISIPDSMPVSIWIDDENRIVRIRVTGPILQTEAKDLIRQIDFSNFNEPIEIEAPAG
jgi:hypothetical protein